MSIIDTAPPEIRAAWRAHQEAVAALRATPAQYETYLIGLKPSLDPHPIRDNAGRQWYVTKLSCLRYIVSGPRWAICDCAADVVALMEAN